MKLLLDNRLAPITTSVAFLEADCATAVHAFTEWNQLLAEKSGKEVPITQKAVSGTLEEALHSLLPLTIPEILRHLFIPTASSWVAYFNNSKLGTDTGSFCGYLPTKLNCRGISARVNVSSRRIDFVEFGLYGSEIIQWRNDIRVVRVSYDETWEFYTYGEPLPFESRIRYLHPTIQNRFTVEMLNEYLKQFNILAFQEDFYLPPGNIVATLVEHGNFGTAQIQEFSLDGTRLPHSNTN